MTEKALKPAAIRNAQERGEKRSQIEPRADRVSYDSARDMIMIDLRGGAIVGLPVAAIRELAAAAPNQLASVRAGFGGESITLEDLDVDVSIPGLLRDLVGITSAAAVLGRKGGSAKSDVKAAAVRENGKRGGRPRKSTQSA
jgi:hypothetical protein